MSVVEWAVVVGLMMLFFAVISTQILLMHKGKNSLGGRIDLLRADIRVDMRDMRRELLGAIQGVGSRVQAVDDRVVKLDERVRNLEVGAAANQ